MSPSAGSTVTFTRETWLLPTLVILKGLPPVLNCEVAPRISHRPELLASFQLPMPPKVVSPSSVTLVTAFCCDTPAVLMIAPPLVTPEPDTLIVAACRFRLLAVVLPPKSSVPPLVMTTLLPGPAAPNDVLLLTCTKPLVTSVPPV